MKFIERIVDVFVDNKYLLGISLFFFVFSLLGGFILGPSLYDFFNPVVDQMEGELSSGVISLTFQSIFLNNIFIVFRMFIFGIFLGFSVVLLVYNGFFLGYFLSSYGDFWRNVVFIVPHGIFELPSIVIATTSGLVLFKFVFRFVRDVRGGVGFGDSLERNYFILNQSLIILGVGCILMFIAGVVESYFTVPIANWVLGI